MSLQSKLSDRGCFPVTMVRTENPCNECTRTDVAAEDLNTFMAELSLSAVGGDKSTQPEGRLFRWPVESSARESLGLRRMEGLLGRDGCQSESRVGCLLSLPQQTNNIRLA